jgi:hypothetical protein
VKATDSVAEIHLALEKLLDGYRRAGTAEEIIAEAAAKAVHGSRVLMRAAELAGGRVRR